MNDMMLLVEPLIPALRRYARALMRDQATADDLVQDCLERTISRWHQRRADGDARTWVFTILHNLAINRLKQRARRGWHVALEDADEAPMAHPAVQEDRLRHRDLLQGLAGLPDDQRSVLLLVSVEDLSYAEAARVLGIPIGTVMSRLARAREKLLKAMEGEATAAPVRGPALRRVK
ncbi:MAG: sigma-70 family RNA polymerase sigma factor [Acetobacteraceae bacterium]